MCVLCARVVAHTIRRGQERGETSPIYEKTCAAYNHHLSWQKRPTPTATQSPWTFVRSSCVRVAPGWPPPTAGHLGSESEIDFGRIPGYQKRHQQIFPKFVWYSCETGNSTPPQKKYWNTKMPNYLCQDLTLWMSYILIAPPRVPMLGSVWIGFCLAAVSTLRWS